MGMVHPRDQNLSICADLLDAAYPFYGLPIISSSLDRMEEVVLNSRADLMVDHACFSRGA